MMGSTKYLGLIADNDCHLVFEKGAPYSARKRDFISLKSRDGRDVSLSTPDGLMSLAEAIRRVVAMPAEQRANVARIGSSDGRFYELPVIEAIARRSDFPRS